METYGVRIDIWTFETSGDVNVQMSNPTPLTDPSDATPLTFLPVYVVLERATRRLFSVEGCPR